jgi:serine/threonine protein kinase
MSTDPTIRTGASDSASPPEGPERNRADSNIDRAASEMSTVTAQAPPFRAPAHPAAAAQDSAASQSAASAAKTRPEFPDFEVLRILGEGSFGRVYLARQISLERQVALKVTANRGSEARTLASLEHDHIVQVFSESVDTTRNQRVLCMQYVPGTTLERIIGAMNECERHTWRGRALLQAIDSLSQHPAAFHPAALRDRELLAESDHFQTVCWFGARLAEALDYAHTRGVLHRDVKPANVLVSSYGRPLLADFNISFQSAHPTPGDDMFGGTLGYMSPEHLDAFLPQSDTPHEAVNEQSDIYSLGVVLFEMLTGERPFDKPPSGLGYAESLRELARVRRAQIPLLSGIQPQVPRVLQRIVYRCLDPDPSRRYQNGVELARALDGCRDLREAELELPIAGPLTATVQRRPFWSIAVLALLPHVLGSVVNISYNAVQIVGQLSPAQRSAFTYLVLAYNLLVYPACVWMMVHEALPVYRLLRNRQPERTEFDTARRRVLKWPLLIVYLAIVGWLPGGIVFPAGLSLFAEPVSSKVFIHFLTSFTISGLVALTYSYFGVQFVVLRVFYPQLWNDAQEFRIRAHTELSGVSRQMRKFQFCSGAIPLIGAILLVGGSEIPADRTFRLLVTGLIGLGMAGFILAVQANSFTSRTVAAYAGTEGKRMPQG